MIRIISIIALLSTIVSCSSYEISTEIDKNSALKKIKKAGIILRTQRHALPPKKLTHQAISCWLEGCAAHKRVHLVKPGESLIGTFENSYDRLSQRSINNRFLKYKTIGVIKLYIRKNREKLVKIMDNNGYSGLIIYEIESSYSSAMQYGEFESIILILNKNLEIVFLDQQKNSYNIDDTDQKAAEKHLLNRISERLISTLADLNFLKK